MIIKIPKNNVIERKYIIDIIFNYHLGINYKLELLNKSPYWEIECINGNKILFNDCFFNRFQEDLSYLKIENIPSEIYSTKNEFILEKDLIIIYGNSSLEISNNNNIKNIKCGIDIFASCFFMLSRWEEYVNKKRDTHDRFVSSESLAFKNNFLKRPIVNEYIEMLKNMLLSIDNNIRFKIHKSNTFVSCDVDEPFDCTVKNIFQLLKVGTADIIKRKNLKEFNNRIKRYIFNKQGNYKYDLNYTFEWYMDVCEEAGLKINFYFIPTSYEKGNACYSLKDKNIIELIKYITIRGHNIGVHGSYQTYNDKVKAKRQKEILENTLKQLFIPQNIKGNRQHYLRWDSSLTPSVLEYSEFEYDTSGGYADMCGFRYGICHDFPMFDFINRKKLKLKQRPLIVMECTVIDEIYLGFGYSEKSYKLMSDLKQKCFKYNGNFTLLWHNNHFKTQEDKKLFKAIINI